MKGMTMKYANKAISGITGFLVFIIAGSAFALSFDALVVLAEGVGITSNKTFLYPVIIDGAVIVFCLSVLRANLNREKAFYQWILVSVFTLISLSLNIVHAQNNALARFVAAIPPLGLFLSFELLMIQIMASTRRKSAIQSLDEIKASIEINRTEFDLLINAKKQELDETVQEKTTQIEKLNDRIQQLEKRKGTLLDDLKQLRSEKKQTKSDDFGSTEQVRKSRTIRKQERMEQLLVYLEDHPNASLSMMADAIGRSKSTADAYISQLKSSSRIQKNHDGWKIL